MASLRWVAPSWYVRFKEDGKERMIRIGPDRESAETARARIELEMAEKYAQRLPCSWCEREIALTAVQKVAAKQRKRIYCSKECHQASEVSGNGLRHRCGPCPTCGSVFGSRTKGRRYCSLACYTSSDEMRGRLLAHNRAKSEEAVAKEEAARLEAGCDVPARRCANCLGPCKRARKFCRKDCMRSYYAERFDRWIADPQKIALPQNYDEFLMQEELPCIVEGCGWVGKYLSYHCNVTHGIPADKLKELAGFNRRTGLIPPGTRKQMAERSRALPKAGLLNRGNLEGFRTGVGHAREALSPRPEAVEHHKKAMADLAAIGVSSRPDRPCRWCSRPVSQPITGARLYCSTYCRSQYYCRKGVGELNCSHCGRKFPARSTQINRARKGQKVCCSDICRNRMNVIAALISRGINREPTTP